MLPEADRRQPYNPLTEGSISRAVVRLAWPVVLAQAVHTLFHVVDLIWVGRLGAWATAAISSSIFAVWTILSVSNLVTVGLTAQVSRAIGAGDRRRASRATAQSLLFTFVLGSIVAVAVGIFAGDLFRAIGVSSEVARAGSGYLRIFALASPLSFLYMALEASMRASGDTRTPMIVSASALLANALLDPFLIYGWGPFPQWGVAGAATATAICQSAAAGVFLIMAFRGHPSLPFDAKALARPDLGMISGLARIGAPYWLVGTLFSFNYLAFAKIASRFGDAAVAVIGISNRVESITYLGAEGFAVAAATLVGQNLGARKPDRAQAAAWTATGYMSLAAAALTVLLLVFTRGVFGVFSGQGEVAAIGAGYLRILALCQVATAVEGVLGGAFAGAGNTVPPMVIHVFMGIARPPLAWALALGAGWGMTGIAVTITATCVLRGIILAALFARGGWKRHTLPRTVLAPLPPEDAPDVAQL